MTYVYYKCAHNPGNPRHFAAAPDHPKTVTVREDDLLKVINEFFRRHRPAYPHPGPVPRT